MTLPHGAVGWSAVSDCGISWSYSPTFLEVYANQTFVCQDPHQKYGAIIKPNSHKDSSSIMVYAV